MNVNYYMQCQSVYTTVSHDILWYDLPMMKVAHASISLLRDCSIASAIASQGVDLDRGTNRRTLSILEEALERREVSLSPDLLDSLG